MSLISTTVRSLVQDLINEAQTGSSSVTNGGIEYSDQGDSILFRDSHLASVITTSDNLWYKNVPRYKFSYYVKFIPTTADASISNLSFCIKMLEKPSFTMESQTLNQYNKKRIIYTGRRYNPISIEFWDTASNTFYDFFKIYMDYYFADSKNTSASNWVKDTTAKTFQTESGFGYTIPSGSTLTNDSLLSTIQVYEMYGGLYRMYEMVNPKITEVRFDALDSTAGGDLSKVRLNLEYEGLNFVSENSSLRNDTDLMVESKLNDGSFYEPSRLITSYTQFNDVPTVSFNSVSKDTNKSVQSTRSGTSSIGGTFSNTSSTKLSSISGKIGLYGSFTDVVGDVITQNSGTLSQAGILSNTTSNSITRAISTLTSSVY